MPSGAETQGETLLKFFKCKGSADDSIELIVDRREAASHTARALAALGVKVEYRTLKVGDYVVSDEVAIERKTYADLAASIVDRRLFSQAQALRECYTRPIIILEMGGNAETGVSRGAIRGAVASMVLDFGIPVIAAEGPEDAAGFIVAIARRERRPSEAPLGLKDRRRPKTPDEEKEYVVASLPMVEVSTARRLLAEFGTVQAVFSASEDELQRVEKIGPKKAKRIREVASTLYGGFKGTTGNRQGQAGLKEQ
ncbi:MAG: helix-hairpin-helix domain-containing protein [Nitrososphaeria archaeon]|nr:helix-hairpin-helix domain-containing protein [Nitrososphaeria archaeon]